MSDSTLKPAENLEVLKKNPPQWEGPRRNHADERQQERIAEFLLEFRENQATERG